MQQGAFKGAYPALITPMDKNGDANYDAIQKIIEFNINAGVDGFWIAGGTGESVYLTEEENNKIAKASVEQCNGRAKIIMHVGSTTTQVAIRQAEYAAKIGVDAICSFPPIVYNPGDHGIIEHYKSIASATNLPFFVYNFPQATGIEITPDLMEKMLDEIPLLQGVKHTAPIFDNMYLFSKMGLDVFIGGGRAMLPNLTIGGAGCVDGPLCFAPEYWVKLFKAYNNGDLKEAEHYQRKGSHVMDELIELGYLQALKFLVGERLGIDCGNPRLPIAQFSEEMKEIARKKLIELQLDPII